MKIANFVVIEETKIQDKEKEISEDISIDKEKEIIEDKTIDKEKQVTKYAKKNQI